MFIRSHDIQYAILVYALYIYEVNSITFKPMYIYFYSTRILYTIYHNIYIILYYTAARAISGGPLYVSDSPGNHNATLLSRLILPNGRVLRTLVSIISYTAC